MKSLLYSKETLIWLVLMAITLVSWVVGTHHGAVFDQAFLEMSMIMILAFYKARLVILNFMEVNHAPATLKLSCEAWVIASCIMVLLGATGAVSQM